MRKKLHAGGQGPMPSLASFVFPLAPLMHARAGHLGRLRAKKTRSMRL